MIFVDDKIFLELTLIITIFVVLTSNTKVLNGAMKVIASSRTTSSNKLKWKEYYSDAFVDLDEGFYSISLNKD